MFQLFRSRKRAFRILLGVIVAPVILSMVIFLIPGITGSTTPSTGEDTVLAVVGNEEIMLREAQYELQEAERQRRLPPGTSRFVAPQIVQDMITQKALLQEAARLGLDVTEQELADLLRTSFPMLFPGGNFVGSERYASFIEQRFQRTVPEFEKLLREDLAVTKLRRLVADGVMVPPAEVEQQYRKQNEKARIEFAAVTSTSVESSVSVTPAEIEEYFKKNRTLYPMPERRSLRYIVIDDARVAPKIQITPQELERYYNENRERFRVQDRARLSHVLFKTTDKKEDEIKKIEVKAQEVLKQARAGKDFAELAKANSEDTPTASKGGEIGWVTRGQTVPEFEQKAFSMKSGEISDLVKTQYGYHIIKLLEREGARVKAFSEVEPTIRQELIRERGDIEKSRLAEAARVAANRQGQNLEAAGREVGLPVFTAGLVTRNSVIPEIGPEPAFNDALFGAAKGVVLGPIHMATKSVIAVVTEIAPPRPAELNEVAERVKNEVRVAKAREATAARAQKLLERAKALNGDLRKAAKEFGLEVKSSDLFARQGSIPGLGSASAVSEAFTAPPHSLLGPVPAGADYVVYKIIERVEPDMAGFNAESKTIRNMILGTRQNEVFEVFKDELRERLKKQGKVKIYQDRIDRFVGGRG